MTKRYIHGDGMQAPLISDEGGSISDNSIQFLHANHQGSVIALSDAEGAVTAVNTYDPFGGVGSQTGRFGYTGQMFLPELDLYYYRARIYNPALGRFLQTDPVGYEDQMNLYAYVGNDPVNFIDSSGKSKQSSQTIGIWLYAYFSNGRDIKEANRLTMKFVNARAGLASEAVDLTPLGVVKDFAEISHDIASGNRGAEGTIAGMLAGNKAEKLASVPLRKLIGKSSTEATVPYIGKAVGDAVEEIINDSTDPELPNSIDNNSTARSSSGAKVNSKTTGGATGFYSNGTIVCGGIIVCR